MEKQLKVGIFGDTDNFFCDPQLLKMYPFLESEKFPEVDVWIAVNNLTSHGYLFEAERFLKFFGDLKSKYKIAVAGPTDLEMDTYAGGTALMDYKKNPNHHYLVNNDCMIEGLRVWGSPFTYMNPLRYSNIFYKSYMEGDVNKLSKMWETIPPDTGILITATPPYSIMDDYELPHGILQSAGSEDLLYAVKKVKPLLHCFSMKKNHGVKDIDGIKFVNGCIRNDYGKPVSSYEVVTIKYNI